MTDLDEIRCELDLALTDPEARERLARELHQLRHLRRVAIARGRRLDAITYTAARATLKPVELDPPPERGCSVDLFHTHNRLTTPA